MKMAEAESTLTRHDLEAKIVKRCWENEAFRKELIANPAGAFAKYLKIPAANLPKIVIYEEPAGSWHIVVPSRPADADELSDQDLERVAGGLNPPWLVASAAALSLSIAGGSAGASASATITLQQGW
jgi:hypothetical protein